MTENLFISTLLNGDVIVETETAGELAFSSDFIDSVDQRTDQVQSGQWVSAFESGVTGGDTSHEVFAAVADDTPELLGTYWALDDALDDVSFTQLLRLLVVVDRFHHPPTETTGTPEGFLPVRGDRVPALVEFIRHGAVYVWRDDCDPCDVMAEQFATLDDQVTEEAVLLSVYGPDWGERLNDAFSVAGAPTTLFIAKGSVDSRLVGPYESDIIAAELETTKRIIE